MTGTYPSIPRVIMILMILLLPLTAASGKDIKVPMDYTTIQLAIDAAVNGDRVIVYDGTYVENIDFKGKAIIVTGAFAMSSPVIDGNYSGSVVTFNSGEGRDSILEGFRIYFGTGTVDNIHHSGKTVGGGIFCGGTASPTLIDNGISDCNASYGGGIGCTGDSNPLIMDNRFNDCGALGGRGGGIYCVFSPGIEIRGNRMLRCGADEGGGAFFKADLNSRFEDNEVENCHASTGGGVYLNSLQTATVVFGNNKIQGNSCSGTGGGLYVTGSPLVIGNIIRRNTALSGGGCTVDAYADPVLRENLIEDNAATSSGGGILIAGYSSMYRPVIERNRIVSNQASIGAGIYCGMSTPVRGNFIAHNVAASEGGGIHCGSDFTSGVESNVIVDNRAYNGGGIMISYFTDTVTLNSNTIVENTASNEGGGIWCTWVISSAKITNSIIRGNTAQSGEQICPSGSNVSVSYSNVEGGWTGTGNFDADPLFVDTRLRDYHLTWDSPCIDKGDSSVIQFPAQDFDGGSRMANGQVDVGADEYAPFLYHASGTIPGAPLTFKAVGAPGDVVRLGIGSGLLTTPINTSYGHLYLRPPYRYNLLGTVPSDGILEYDTFVPHFWDYDERHYFQAIIGAALSNVDVHRFFK